MKILYINVLYSPYVAGGAEISLKLIAESMQARGHDVAVLSLAPREGIHSEQVDGVRVYRAGLRNYYWPFSQKHPNAFRRLAWHLRDRYNAAIRSDIEHILQIEQPDVVSCHNLVGWSVAVWDEIARANIPFVQVLHDMYLLCANSNMYKEEGACHGQCFRCRVLRTGHERRSLQASAVVGISRNILDRFRGVGYFAGVPHHVIYNARRIPAVSGARKREPGAPLKIGYIGTLSPIKGVEWLITQFRKSKVEGSLYIAGRGQAEYVRHLENLVATDPRITFAGYVDAADFYAGIDLLVVPSCWEEPLGMVAVEGLANNLPVIASNRGGLPETVIHGVNGLLCEPAEPDSLGEALTALWQDNVLYNQLSQRARQSIAPLLNPDRMAGEYETVLQAAIKK
ncbi:glycosyltransferase family 4 protein [Parapedobacter lycopersici]|uniref:glycosyltransferase family 4 protein n=1 Tax=Parapedobacter lycopersici TaxID=1864939 RepID=UPI00333F9635